MTTFIYFLKDPENPNKGYVGKSDNPRNRLFKHLSDKEICHRTNWIRSLTSRRLKPLLEIIDEVPEEHWQQWEVAYIEFFREQGFELTNGTPGGDSGPSSAGIKHSPERIAKRAAKLKGQKRTLEQCAAMSARQFGKKIPLHVTKAARAANIGNTYRLGKPHSLETRAKLSTYAGEKSSFFGKKHSPETRAKMSASQKGKPKPPEHCAAIGAAQRGKRLSFEHRAKISTALAGKKKSQEHTANAQAAKQRKKSQKEYSYVS